MTTTPNGRPHRLRPGCAWGSGRAGQRGAAHPQAAGRAVGAGHRDRGRGHRGGARPGQLFPGRAAGRDQPAGHQPAHRHQRAEPGRRPRRAARRRPRHDQPSCPVSRPCSTPATVSNVNAYRSPYSPRSTPTRSASPPPASACRPRSGTTVAAGQLPQRRHRQRARRRAGAAAAQRMGIDRVWPGMRIWVGGMWFYVAGILNPAVAGPRDRHLGPGRLPRRRALPRLRRAPVRALRPHRQHPGRRQPVDSLLGARPTRRTPARSTSSQPSSSLIAQADAAGAFDTPVPRPGRGRAAGRRGRRGQHHDHLRPRTPSGDRAAQGPGRHQGPDPHPVPVRGDLARAAGRRGRGDRRRGLTAVYAHAKGWPIVIPAEAWAGGLAAAIAIGALAGLLPAIRAARLSPTQALWSL